MKQVMLFPVFVKSVHFEQWRLNNNILLIQLTIHASHLHAKQNDEERALIKEIYIEDHHNKVKNKMAAVP